MQRDDIRKDDSVGEEISAVGQRAKGAIKDAVGAVTGNSRLEREGERENAEGRSRQARNYVTGLYRSPEEVGRAYDSLTTKTRVQGRRHQRDDGRRDPEEALW